MTLEFTGKLRKHGNGTCIYLPFEFFKDSQFPIKDKFTAQINVSDGAITIKPVKQQSNKPPSAQSAQP